MLVRSAGAAIVGGGLAKPECLVQASNVKTVTLQIDSGFRTGFPLRFVRHQSIVAPDGIRTRLVIPILSRNTSSWLTTRSAPS